MTSSTDDETGAESTRHRSHDHRISRWRRRHEEMDDEVAELDPAELAALMQRAARADQEPERVAREGPERAQVDDPAIRRVISDALKVGLADPSPGDDRRRLLPRRRSEGDRPAVPSPDDPADLEARLRATEARAEEYAAELRQARQEMASAEQRAAEERVRLEQQLSEQHAEQLRRLQAELEQAEERSRALAAETAARATEHSERVRALVLEREAAEAQVAAFERQLDEGHVLPTLAPVAPEPEPEPEAVEPPVEPEQDPAPEPETVPVSPAPARAGATPYDVKRGAGPLGPAAGVVALGCAAAVGWMAYQATVLDHPIPSLVLTVIALLGLTIALRQRSKSSEVHLDNGTLRLRHGDRHHTFYLTSTSTQLEMTGRPGDRDWKVQVLRRGMEPVTVNQKDVDPVAFTEALRQWRPNL